MPARSSFRTIKDEIARRIGEREWKPGTLIPGEEALALEFGAARATVNRALQELARSGLIERKRKVGTRVALNPIREARFAIPIVGVEIVRSGATYEYRLLHRAIRDAPDDIAARMEFAPGTQTMHLTCLHLADGTPYQLEDRHINLDVVPKAREESFAAVGPNEWLVNNSPFSRAEFSFLAATASAEEAAALEIAPGAPVFVGERRTWILTRPVTIVRMVHPPSHRLTMIV